MRTFGGSSASSNRPITSFAKYSRYGSTVLLNASSDETSSFFMNSRAHVGTFDQKLLVVPIQLVKLALLPGDRTVRSVDRWLMPSIGCQLRPPESERSRASARLRSAPNGPVPSGPLVTSSIDAAGFEPSHEPLAPSRPRDLTLSRLGVVSRPGAPPVPGGITNSGPFDASTTSIRGAIRLATSASPNCSSSPKTFRSTGCRQMSLRSPKKPLTHTARSAGRGPRHRVRSSRLHRSRKPRSSARSPCWSDFRASTRARTFCTS